MLWVTHEPGLMLPHLDQVLLLKDGQLDFNGRPQDARKEAEYQPYFQV